MPWNTIDAPYNAGTEISTGTFVPSEYQQDVFDWIANGEGHGVIDAVAGSGKSRTLVEAAKLLNGDSVIFCAFNKSIVNDLVSKLPHGVQCKTINSIGHGALMNFLGSRKLELNDRKYKTLARDIENDLNIDYRKPADSRKCVDQLVNFAQSTLVDTSSNEAMIQMAEKYSIEIPEERGASVEDFCEIVRFTLEAGVKLAVEQKVISFNDQIWLPTIFRQNADPKMAARAYPMSADWVFIDECQDLSKSKLELILMMRAKRYLFVGDPHQSIYGFAGADPASFQEIIDRTQATVMPLSICYRCPKSHVELAQEIVPHIVAHDDAIEGEIVRIPEASITTVAQAKDLILCRFTAPLIKVCIRFIKQRIPASIKGRDIGEQLCKFAREALLKSSLPYSEMEAALEIHVERETVRLLKRENSEGLIQSCKDKAAGVRACWSGFRECQSLEALEAAIGAIFSDASSPIQLSSLHRAKGLEANNVFLLLPDILPFVWLGQSAWQYEQEQNVEYVAKTRAKEKLYFVTSSDDE